MNENYKHAIVFMKAREALYVYFRQLKKTVGSGTVLIPAQTCPVVLHSVQAAGFSARFVDSDLVYPTPSASQYHKALRQDTVGIVISPLYGYIQKDWESLLQNVGEIKIVLDLAQGLMLNCCNNSSLYQRADAIVYSFGLGKGLDTGGALLLSVDPLDIGDYSPRKKLYCVGPLFRVIILRVLIMSGLYAHFLSHVEAEIEVDKEFKATESSKYLAPANIYLLWEAKLNSFGADIRRARKRAEKLSRLPVVRQACRDLSFFSPHATHLRQIIRFRDPKLRDSVLDALHKEGVDCAPAGEPLPNEYFDNCDLPDFPNARAFRQEAIRLAFLGRLSEAEFGQIQDKLESAIVQHLS
jgi:dTDP-4-amino-4,6-dideoxygalactose transaminase